MNGCCSIDFVPEDGAVARILSVVHEAGLTLRGIRLIPCPANARATLRLELAVDRRDQEHMVLEELLLKLEFTIEVIHRASCCTAAATGNARANSDMREAS
jgi:hypothetical protein